MIRAPGLPVARFHRLDQLLVLLVGARDLVGEEQEPRGRAAHDPDAV
jgi:hypothetical protein